MAGKGQKVAICKDLTNGLMKRDKLDVQNITNTISSMINPFDNDPEVGAGDLVNLSSGTIASSKICSDLITVHRKGDAAFIAFCKERLQGKTDINDKLKKQKLKTFSDASKPKTVVVKGKIVNVRSDRELLSRLVVIGRMCDIDIQQILLYCLNQFPLSLATSEGCHVKTNNTILLHVLQTAPDISHVEVPNGSVWIVDGMVMLQQISSKNMPQNIGLLAEILKELVYLETSVFSNVIHFVTDCYPEISIKNAE
ncbi:Hypothetical predicted protein [Paramuricea clavata]|uniref:Uncharacterized protein n=1 Tax=Paramuricea clavata TaxID=317549 RepID=A0A6S7IZJ5_PARCT|nr:Hypothetical predicted protein [Paramuricea clavata]